MIQRDKYSLDEVGKTRLSVAREDQVKCCQKTAVEKTPAGCVLLTKEGAMHPLCLDSLILKFPKCCKIPMIAILSFSWYYIKLGKDLYQNSVSFWDKLDSPDMKKPTNVSSFKQKQTQNIGKRERKRKSEKGGGMARWLHGDSSSHWSLVPWVPSSKSREQLPNPPHIKKITIFKGVGMIFHKVIHFSVTAALP